jgi:hypothetical protein
MTEFNSKTDSFIWLFVDEKDNVSRVVPNVRNAAEFLGPCQSCVDSSDLYWHGGALYALATGGRETGGDGAGFRHHFFAKWEGGGWSLVGTYKTRETGEETDLLRFVPCDGGRFIVISDKTDLFDGKRTDRSPFCRMSAAEGGGEMRLDASIDHGQDALRKYMPDPDCFKLALFSDVIITEGRATLVNRDTGLYWVFSTETAALVKAGSIFGGMAPERMANGGIGRAVLCVNPEKSGTVLLSAQDEALLLAEKEDAWREVREMYDRLPDGQCDEGINEFLVRRLEEIKARSLLIVWYRIHPENGRVERLPAPPEGGASIREGWDNERWRPMPDGSVRMGWDPHYVDKVKAQASNWVGDPKGETAPKEASGAEPDAEGDAPAEGDGGGAAASQASRDKVASKDSAPAAPR